MYIINPIVSDWPNFVFKYMNIFHVWLTQYCHPLNRLQSLGCTRNPTFLAHLTTTHVYNKPYVFGTLNSRCAAQKTQVLGTLINRSATQGTPTSLAHLSTARLHKAPLRPWHTYQPLNCARNPTSQAHLSTTQLYKKPHPSYGSYPHSICLISLLWARKVQLPHLRNISLISFLILLPHLHQNPGLCGRYSDYATGCTSELFWCNFT